MNEFMLAIEIIGTIAFAVSGSVIAVRGKMDLFGVLTLGVVCAVGGGVIRDITLGNTPPVAFREPVYLIISLIASLISFAVFKMSDMRESRLKHIGEKLLFAADTLGLAIFTVVGMKTAEDMGQDGKTMLIFVGVITGVGGGMLRDLFAGRIPHIFRKHIYATASILGAVCYILIRNIVPSEVSVLIVIGVIAAIRIMSAAFGWNLPGTGRKD